MSTQPILSVDKIVAETVAQGPSHVAEQIRLRESYVASQAHHLDRERAIIAALQAWLQS